MEALTEGDTKEEREEGEGEGEEAGGVELEEEEKRGCWETSARRVREVSCVMPALPATYRPVNALSPVIMTGLTAPCVWGEGRVQWQQAIQHIYSRTQ